MTPTQPLKVECAKKVSFEGNARLGFGELAHLLPNPHINSFEKLENV